jgi:hypothetical protein
MTTYFEAPDGHDEPTLWAVTGNQHAVPVLRRSDVPKFWPDIVARMTGTTVVADDVHRAVDAARAAYWNVANGEPPSLAMYEAAILAALTGVPVEPVDAHRHYFVDVSTFAAAGAGRHNWLCECGATDETRDRA